MILLVWNAVKYPECVVNESRTYVANIESKVMKRRKVVGTIMTILNTIFEFEVCKIEVASPNFSVWQGNIGLERERKIDNKGSANGQFERNAFSEKE